MTNDTKKQAKILVVDDNAVSLKRIARQLQSAGFDVDMQESAHDILDTQDRNRYDLVLLDIMMPEIDGMEALDTLRSKHDGVSLPIIMVTAKSEDEDVASAFEAGANDYIVKPVNFPVALARIQHHLHMRDLDQDIRQQQTISHNHGKLSSLGSLARGMAHEVNNPLAIISGNAQVIRNRVDTGKLDKDRLRTMVSRVQENVHRIRSIMDCLSIYVSDEEDTNFEYIDTKKLVENALHLFSNTIKKQDIEIQADLEHDINLFCRPKDVHVAIISILDNAVKAVKGIKEPRLTISAKVTDGLLRLSITDNGPGIPEDQHESVFEPFFTTRETGQGRGLGLSTAVGVIKAHNGKIELSSSDSGSSFTIVLPFEGASQHAA